MAEKREVKARKKRSDAGSRRLGPRDFEALAFIEDMRVVGEPDLGVLLGKMSGRSAIGEAGVRDVVRRWESQGLASVSRVLVGHPRFVQVTQAGSDLAAGGHRVSAVSWRMLDHEAAVARVRIIRESETGVAWYSERRLIRDGWVRTLNDGSARRDAWEKTHRPDGLIIHPDGTVEAVEVEMRAKARRDTRAIALEVLTDSRYERATYYAGDEATAEHLRSEVVHVGTGLLRGEIKAPLGMSGQELNTVSVLPLPLVAAV
jgi:hypothetical protein